MVNKYEIYPMMLRETRKYMQYIQESKKIMKIDIPKDKIHGNILYVLDSAINTTENIISLSFLDIVDKIKYGKRYSLKEFFNMTGLMIEVFYGDTKLYASECNIFINGRFSMNIEILNLDVNEYEYIVYINRITKSYERSKSFHLSLDEDEVNNHIFYVDGKLTYPNPEYDNEIYYINITSDNYIEHMVLDKVSYNGIIESIRLDGNDVIQISNKTTVSPNLIFYSNMDDKSINNATNKEFINITNGAFKVPQGGTYYVCVVSDSIPMSVNSLYKYEQLFGSVIENFDTLPNTFMYENSNNSVLEIYKHYPDAYKKYLEYKYSFNLQYRIASDYPLKYDTSDVSDNPVTFSEGYRHIKFAKKSHSFVIIIDGIVISPDYIYDNDYYYNLYFKDSKLADKEIVILSLDNYHTEALKYKVTIDENYQCKLPPNKHLEKNIDNLIFVDERIDERSMIILDAYRIDVIDGVVTFTFDPNESIIHIDGGSADTHEVFLRDIIDIRDDGIGVHWFGDVVDCGDGSEPVQQVEVGKTYSVYCKNVGYSEYMMTDYMSIDLENQLLYNEHDLFVSVDGLLNNMHKLINPNTQYFLNENPVLAFNYNNPSRGDKVQILKSENKFILISKTGYILLSSGHIPIFVANIPNMKVYQYMYQLKISQNIIELNDKTYPFSTEYMMVFINNKFIHPKDIVIISTYKFGLRNFNEPINNILIYKNNYYDAASELFKNIKTHWDEYIDTLDESELKNKLNLSDIVMDTNEKELEHRYLYLYETFYKYFLGNQDFEFKDEEEIYKLLEDFKEISFDGRIVLDAYRDDANSAYYIYGDV